MLSEPVRRVERAGQHYETAVVTEVQTEGTDKFYKSTAFRKIL